MADARVGPVPAGHHRRQHREHSRHESLPPQDKKDGLPHRNAGDSPGSAPADSDAGPLFLGNYIFVGGWGSVFCSVRTLLSIFVFFFLFCCFLTYFMRQYLRTKRFVPCGDTLKLYSGWGGKLPTHITSGRMLSPALGYMSGPRRGPKLPTTYDARQGVEADSQQKTRN